MTDRTDGGGGRTVSTAIGGKQPVRYRAAVADSALWEGFAFRPDDIVISTPPKCGTTWTQMITALLLFGGTDFPDDLGRMSPWFDSTMQDHDAVLATLHAQRHRRFLKSHTPLDGLPFDERVTYVCVGRDPRDVGLSWGNHMANIDREAHPVATAVGGGLPDGPASEAERFRRWVEDDGPVTDGPRSLRSTLHHLATFWDARERDNVALLHYDELQADLPAAMRRLAGRLGVAVDEAALPALAEAAGFEQMRDRADRLVPEADLNIWQNNRDFFRRGSSGYWRDVLDADDRAAYRARVTALAPADLSAWLHRPVPLDEQVARQP
jgi:aryl sulfotransferase